MPRIYNFKTKKKKKIRSFNLAQELFILRYTIIPPNPKSYSTHTAVHIEVHNLPTEFWPGFNPIFTS
jgi:hypothetical protein